MSMKYVLCVQNMSKPWLIVGRVAYLYTDSFLVISGLLAAHTLSRFSPVKSVVARYIRLVRLLLYGRGSSRVNGV